MKKNLIKRDPVICYLLEIFLLKWKGKTYIPRHILKKKKKKAWLAKGFPGGWDGKESACSAGDQGLIPELGSSLGKRNGNSIQYCCLENPMDRGARWATVHGVENSRTQLSD